MTVHYPLLGQVIPAAATPTDLYVCAAPVIETVGSTVVVCNQGAATTVRIAFRKANFALTAKQYVWYDVPLAANESKSWTVGFTMQATDVITVQSASGSVSFTAFGSELS